ncbi:MAG: sigma 54-interacting transcriptional regulator, partial [Clostridium sp.]
MLENLDSSIYKEILDYLPYEVFVTDDKGFILYCNNAFSTNYCYDVNDLLGKHVKTISPSIKKGKAIIPLVIKNKKEISLFQETIHGKKLLLTAKPLLDTDGNIKIIIESGREILNAPHNLNNSTSEDNFLSSPDSTLDSYNPELSVFTNLNNFKALIKIAKYDVTILLLGESGTGKSTCAKFIHASSLRKDQPFITVNCTTIPESLIESELFGYVKGAFT